MSTASVVAPPRALKDGARLEQAPYTTQDLVRDIPISSDDDQEPVNITCVEFHDDNLYVGLSNGELIHFVSVPGDPTDSSAPPTLIQASRRPIDFREASSNGRGIEQILILPILGKACILCNGTLSYYSLPELSPAHEQMRVSKCSCLGGLDLDLLPEEATEEDEVFVYGSDKRFRLVHLGERPKLVRDIGRGGCTSVQRRGTVACVADSRSYSLVETLEQQSYPLFEICSQAEPAEEAAPDSSDKPLPAVPAASEADAADEIAARKDVGEEAESAESSREPPRKHTEPLKPNISSPTPSEFLLTTGTSADEQGVGIFVNLDGDVIRGTLQFSTYPDTILTDGSGIDPAEVTSPEKPMEEGYVLAVVSHQTADPVAKSKRVEIQRWDVDPSEENIKTYLDIGVVAGHPSHIGLRRAASGRQLILSTVTDRLALRKAEIKSNRDQGHTLEDEEIRAREQSESQFVTQLAFLPANILAWADNSIFWLVRTPLLLQLDARLQRAVQDAADANNHFIQRDAVGRVLNDLRGLEAVNELDFLTFKFVQQKASLLLFLDLVIQLSTGQNVSDGERAATENALIQAETDPRLVLAVIHILHNDVFGASRLWVQGGLATLLQTYFSAHPLPEKADSSSALVRGIFGLIKNFLLAWRRKKGFGSISDEEDIFKSVDAALLHLLLILDDKSQSQLPNDGTTRRELNNLVDAGIDCFEYGIELCEKFKRLYILSRIYQSKKQPSMVLNTWRRILEGETDVGGDLPGGEESIKNYLRQRKRPLVEEYGTWLAQRNPAIGVQVFADPDSQTKFQPKEVVELLKEKAPNAVKMFLEHLVFGNNLPQYANDLVGYYLDSVLDELKSSKTSRSLLLDSYEAYKALTAPKPTYSQFVTANSIEAEWWRNRLRLLQLLGGSHGAASQYDIAGISSRIEKYRDYLVPETIALSGRQGQHDVAIQMLTHRLGDFDTAVSYCVLGGSSTYSPLPGRDMQASLPSHEDQSKLFQLLLLEFFKIEDTEARLQQTGELLDRFSGWFDLDQVLSLIPDDWSIAKLSGFLQSSLRKLVTEHHDTLITRALTGRANMSASVRLIEKIETLGSQIELEPVTQTSV